MTANALSYPSCRRAVAAVFAIALTVVARPASASTIGISGTTLIAGADDFAQLTLTASLTGGDLLLEGEPFQIVTQGCTAEGATAIRCGLAGITALTIVGSELDDVVNVSAVGALSVFVATKDGNDIIIGGTGDEILSAGRGDDIVFGNSVHTVIFTGPGDDLVIGCCRSGGLAPPDPEPLQAQSVPEPSTMLLVGMGLGGAALTRKRGRAGSRPQRLVW